MLALLIMRACTIWVSRRMCWYVVSMDPGCLWCALCQCACVRACVHACVCCYLCIRSRFARPRYCCRRPCCVYGMLSVVYLLCGWHSVDLLSHSGLCVHTSTHWDPHEQSWSYSQWIEYSVVVPLANSLLHNPVQHTRPGMRVAAHACRCRLLWRCVLCFWRCIFFCWCRMPTSLLVRERKLLCCLLQQQAK